MQCRRYRRIFSTRSIVALLFFTVIVLRNGEVFNLQTSGSSKTTTHNLKEPPSSGTPNHSHFRELPESCKPYITDEHKLLLKYGRYARVPGRSPPYDHNSCFIMKPRYNCATADSSKAKAYEWKFILQSNISDDLTICDVGAIVDELGGPAATSGEVALFGSSFQRQIFEAIACKYQDQLTKAIVLKDPPSVSLTAIEEREGKPFSSAEFGEPVALPLDRRPIPRCSGTAANFSSFFHPDVKLTTPHFTKECSDDLAVMEYNQKLKIFYNFHPERLESFVDSFKKMIGLNVSTLTYMGVNSQTVGAFRPYLSIMKKGAQFVRYDGMVATLRKIQRRDAKRFFGANNPFVTRVPDIHSCMPGPADDEASLFLFSLIFGIRGFVYALD